MIETPAAVINIDKIAEKSDFLSLGTNDLIQYTMAAGRENPNVADYFEAGATVVMKYVKKTVAAAAKAKIDCCICGEIAGDTGWTRKLLKTGLRCLSVSPLRIPEIKEKVRSIKI
jgi:phosphotransferase system enzyme I (PtsI)